MIAPVAGSAESASPGSQAAGRPGHGRFGHGRFGRRVRFESVRFAYRQAVVLPCLDLDIPAGQTVALVGETGAGKTTILKAISGLIKPVSGEVRFEGEDLLARSSFEIPRRGIAHVPEGRGLFPSLSVMDNLLLGAYVRKERERSASAVGEVVKLFPWLEDRAGHRR